MDGYYGVHTGTSSFKLKNRKFKTHDYRVG